MSTISTETAVVSGIRIKGVAISVRSLGTLVAAAALVVAGIVFVVMGFTSASQVRAGLAQEHITLTPDAAQLVKGAKPGAQVDSATTAWQMQNVIRHHSLEATGGLVYADMGHYLTSAGKPTNDASKAAIDPKTHQPVENQARNIWVTATTWRTSLITAYMGFKLALLVSAIGALFVITGLGLGFSGVRFSKVPAAA